AAPTQELSDRTFGLFFPSYWSYKAPWLKGSKPNWCKGFPFPSIPSFGGGDKGKCDIFWYKILNWKYCTSGNQPSPLPGGCNPPSNGGGGPVCKDGFQLTYSDYKTVATSGVYQGKTVGAAASDPSYLTYGLTKTIDDCLDACDAVQGCVFVNFYQDNADSPEDVNDLPDSVKPKYVKGNYTCAMFSKCLGTESNTNYGGQQDPTYITESSGYCKSGKC
ncbi:hypothetical protein IE53DRAFT_304554, partial [Violaceomyces palustris]